MVAPMLRNVLLIAMIASLGGCDDEQGRGARAKVHEDAPTLRRVVREDLRRARVGVRKAADMMARGFLVEDAAQREREMRRVLQRINEPPRGIPELMVSPISFLAAVGPNGRVIARDSDPDPMRDFDIGRAAPVVRRALREGVDGMAVSELPSLREGELPSVTILFVAAARREDRVVGAIVAGLPLWRLGQQLSNQLQLEHARELHAGGRAWVLIYRGDERHFHADFPPDLQALAPDPAARREGFSRSETGYTGEIQTHGRWFGYGVIPLPAIDEDVGIVVFRSNPD
jgi:hypothetical protein